MAGFRPFFIFAPLAILFAVFMAAGAILQPPPVRSTNSAEQFDTSAAIARLERILGDETPHPVDSDAQDAVRTRLLAEIETLGLRPEVRDDFACRPAPNGQAMFCARVRNIIFQIGPEQGPAVLAAAHYDSVPAAPGAADDGLGIAVLLEAARVLRDQEHTRRIIFLISDGEEPGLIGAHSFATTDPLMEAVEALVNVEARGTRGPATFFESNQPNADAVSAFSGAPRGIASSVMADVYALLPNSTDVSALTRDGLDVVNLALLDGVEDYHTPQDSLASLDQRSVQHAGDIALHTLQRFASSADRDATTEMVYTDIGSFALLSAPRIAAEIVLGVALVIAFAAFWRTGREHRWRSFASPLVALISATALAFGAGFALTLLRPGESYAWAYPEPARAWCVLFALLGALLALMLARGARNPAQAEAAGFFWYAAVGLAASFALPGVTIFFAAPALLFAIGALLAFAWRPAQMLGACLAACLALATWAPSIALTELALGFEFPLAFAALMVIVLFTTFGWIARCASERLRTPVLIVALLAVGAVSASALVPAATAERQTPLNVVYVLDNTVEDARLALGTAQRRLPAAFEGFSAAPLLPGDSVETWVAPAPIQPLPAASLTDITTSIAGGERIVRARIAAGGAGRVILRIPSAAQPLRASLNGAEIEFGAVEDFVSVICNGRACEGAMLEVALAEAGDAAADWFIIGQTPGVTTPESAALIARRPPERTSIQNGDGAITINAVRP
jgi:hypothetical protein